MLSACVCERASNMCVLACVCVAVRVAVRAAVCVAGCVPTVAVQYPGWWVCCSVCCSTCCRECCRVCGRVCSCSQMSRCGMATMSNLPVLCCAVLQCVTVCVAVRVAECISDVWQSVLLADV